MRMCSAKMVWQRVEGPTGSASVTPHASSPAAADSALKAGASLQVTLLDRFPLTDTSALPLTPMLGSLPLFCFQEGLKLEAEQTRNRTPAFFSFVCTTGTGSRLHVACLLLHEKLQTSGGVLYVPKAFCIMSQFPCRNTFRQLLTDLLVTSAERAGPKPCAALIRAALFRGALDIRSHGAGHLFCWTAQHCPYGSNTHTRLFF